MFAIYCTRHRRRVLLFSDDIVAVVNQEAGIDLHWRCPCGEEGVSHVGAPSLAVAP